MDRGPRLVGRADRRARRRHPRQHAVPVREPRRMHHRESGRINLGLEGILVMGAMTGYAVSYLTGNPWLGVLAAGFAGMLAARPAARPDLQPAARQRHRRRHRPDAVRHRPRVLPRQALRAAEGADAPAIPFGGWSDSPQIQAALQVNPLFLIGIALASRSRGRSRNTRWGLIVRMVGDSADAARAMGYNVNARAHAGHGGRRLSRRHRRLVPVALLPRAAGTRACRAARA